MINLSNPLGTIGDRTVVRPTSSQLIGYTLNRFLGSAALICLIATGVTAIQGESSPALASTTAKPVAQSPTTKAPAFRTAVNAAMKAAQLSQTAKTASDWQAIVQSWELAIAQMNAVPNSDRNAAIAQRKAIEYTKNLDYAHQALAQQAQPPAANPSVPSTNRKPIKAAATPSIHAKQAQSKETVVQQSLTTHNPFPALLQVPLQSLQTNPWLGKGAIVLAAATGIIGLLTLEITPARARKTHTNQRDRDTDSIFFSNIGKGFSGLLAQLGDLPLQPSPAPLKSDKVQRKLFRKLVFLAKDEATAVRLIKGYLQRHPEHSMDWCCEKAILDLQQST